MPMVSAPPGRFSTTTGWPSDFAISGASMRATVSVALPAACGTMSRNGLSGNCAAAGAGRNSAAAQASNSPAAAFTGLALEAGAHEFLAVVALLALGLLVAVLHPVLLRLLLLGGAGILALQAGAHRLLALVALLVAHLRVAVLHALLLRLLLLARLLLLVLRLRRHREEQAQRRRH